MINITDKSRCCGCNACVQRCPKGCIAMREDEEGFLYPAVDAAQCIECGLCEKVCPVLHPNEPKKPLHVYAAKNKNEEQRLRSSSGGIFILLAEHVIQQGGVVFGARFDKDWEVEHAYAETMEEVEPLMRSKYVQSRIGNAYVEAERFIKQGRKVLFVGTSCQIAGLRRFLGKDYDNLLAVDFICHGVPSPGVWRQYLKEITSSRSEAAGKNTVLSFSLKTTPAIAGVNFREKQNGGYGWKKYGFVVLTSPVKGDKNSVLLSSKFSDNPYMKAFLQNLILRPSCYACVAKDGRSMSDITIADFWGIGNSHPDFDDDKGCGLLLLHTERGRAALSALSDALSLLPVTLKDATASNPVYHHPVSVPHQRSQYWQLTQEGKTLSEAMAILNHVTLPNRIKAKLRLYCLTLPKRVVKKALGIVGLR